MVSKSEGLKRRLQVIGIAILAVTALGAMTGGAAQAATPEWFVNGAKLAGSETLKSEGGPFLIGLFAPRGGNIECQYQQGTGTIVGPRAETESTGLRFGGCVALGAPTCKVTPIHFVSTKAEISADGNTVYDRIKPASGTIFTNITISGCSAAGSFPITGEVCGEAEALGVELVNQPLRFSTAISKACGSSGLKWAGSPVPLTGTWNRLLTGPNMGKKWSVK